APDIAVVGRDHGRVERPQSPRPEHQQDTDQQYDQHDGNGAWPGLDGLGRASIRLDCRRRVLWAACSIRRNAGLGCGLGWLVGWSLRHDWESWAGAACAAVRLAAMAILAVRYSPQRRKPSASQSVRRNTSS